VNKLADRKLLLIRQAELYREILVLEQRAAVETIDHFRVQFRSTRWWLLGGVACAGWLLSSKFAGLARWVPTALAVARFAQRSRR
jgi:hypothetical protein